MLPDLHLPFGKGADTVHFGELEHPVFEVDRIFAKDGALMAQSTDSIKIYSHNRDKSRPRFLGIYPKQFVVSWDKDPAQIPVSILVGGNACPAQLWREPSPHGAESPLASGL